MRPSLHVRASSTSTTFTCIPMKILTPQDRCASNRGGASMCGPVSSTKKIVGPNIIQETLTGQRYLVLLQDVLPDLLRSAGVSNQARRTIWFQQDGAPAHFSKEVRQYLDQAFQVDGSDDVDPESGHRVLLIL